jgi:hypothetical protein
MLTQAESAFGMTLTTCAATLATLTQHWMLAATLLTASGSATQLPRASANCDAIAVDTTHHSNAVKTSNVTGTPKRRVAQ